MVPREVRINSVHRDQVIPPTQLAQMSKLFSVQLALELCIAGLDATFKPTGTERHDNLGSAGHS